MNLITTDSDKAAAKAKLEEKIAKSAAGAQAAIEQIRDQVPTDRIVGLESLKFSHLDGRLAMGVRSRHLMHANAINQASDMLGGPKLAQYVREQLAAANGDDWRVENVCRNLNEHAEHAGEKRGLVRMVKGGAEVPEVRALLSDQFRRLDCRPMLDAFVSAAQDAGCVAVDGTASDLFVSIRALSPELVKVGGDWVCFGAEFRNSDFGHGALSVRSFVLRLWCLNGATTENNLRHVHLGKRLPDDVKFAADTYLADTQATSLALRDSARMVFSHDRREQLSGRIERAIGTDMNWNALKGSLSRQLTKEELRKVQESFESEDTHNLPPGANAWRASNALSWVAHTVKSADRREELEQLAGSFLLSA